MSGARGKNPLFALSNLRKWKSGQNARRHSHQRFICAARQGANGGGFAAGGEKTDFCPRNRAAGKIASIVFGAEIAFCRCRGRIWRDGWNRDFGKRARSARRSDSGRV